MGNADLVEHVGDLLDLAGLDNVAAGGDERALIAAAGELSADLLDGADAMVGYGIEYDAICHIFLLLFINGFVCILYSRGPVFSICL